MSRGSESSLASSQNKIRPRARDYSQSCEVRSQLVLFRYEIDAMIVFDGSVLTSKGGDVEIGAWEVGE